MTDPLPTPPPGVVNLGQYCIVYFGNDWFAENRTSSHHIARRLAAIAPVLYIEVPGFRTPRASARDFRKIWRKLAGMFAAPRKIGDRFYVMTLPQIPFRRWPLVETLNLWLGLLLARRALRGIGFRRLISWFLVPHPALLAGRLRESMIVYYCIDDFAAFPGVDAPAIQALDDRLTHKADLVFVAHAGLAESKRDLNPRVHLSPHGVDAELFARASDPATTPPEGARTLRHPVIGYFGSLGEWIDFDLLLGLARARPGWTLLLIGFASADTRRLEKQPNIILAGAQPYETLPSWAKAFDVALIPYRPTRQVRNANPLKLREYLATGKPVVSVTTPETSRFRNVLYLADTPEEFLQAIEQALAESDPSLRAARMNAVSAFTWDARVRETVSIVERALSEKPVRDVQ
jgi:glycosyltransferase involved in cell wall biosynthesis